MSYLRSSFTAALTVAALCLVAGCATTQDLTSSSDGNLAALTGGAAELLGDLPVKGRAPMSGYDRDAGYGPDWADTDGNGCDQRNDMLARDLTDVVTYDGASSCVVESGNLDDPYTGKVVRHVRGDGFGVDIDHVVALGNSWVSGAQQWPYAKRLAFANDPLNLLAVEAAANRQKSDADAATWLPQNKSYRCTYVARQITVKAKYGLWVTPAEREAFSRVLAGCPGEPATTDVWGHDTTADSAAAQAGAGASAVNGDDTGTWYPNCDAARAAGAAPVVAGDLGYGPHLDRDGDGSACE